MVPIKPGKLILWLLWEDFKEYPIVLIAIGGKGEWRFENTDGSKITNKP